MNTHQEDEAAVQEDVDNDFDDGFVLNLRFYPIWDFYFVVKAFILSISFTDWMHRQLSQENAAAAMERYNLTAIFGTGTKP